MLAGLKINVRAVDCEIGNLPGAQLHTDGYDGQAKIIVDEDRHIMVGATFIGPQVGDLLHAAYNSNCRSGTIRETLACHTTFSYCE